MYTCIYSFIYDVGYLFILREHSAMAVWVIWAGKVIEAPHVSTLRLEHAPHMLLGLQAWSAATSCLETRQPELFSRTRGCQNYGPFSGP